MKTFWNIVLWSLSLLMAAVLMYVMFTPMPEKDESSGGACSIQEDASVSATADEPLPCLDGEMLFADDGDPAACSPSVGNLNGYIVCRHSRYFCEAAPR